jgi:hypothetical protein
MNAVPLALGFNTGCSPGLQKRHRIEIQYNFIFARIVDRSSRSREVQIAIANLINIE